MIESPVVADWKRRSEDKGILEGKIEAVLRILGRRGAVPEDLAGRIGACQDDGQFDRWMDATLDEFRSRAGL